MDALMARQSPPTSLGRSSVPFTVLTGGSCDTAPVIDTSYFPQWENIPQDRKIVLIHEWINRPWSSMREFCDACCVDLKSTTARFSVLGLLTIDRAAQKDDRLEEAESALCDTLIRISDAAGQVVQHLVVKLSQSDLSLEALKEMLRRLTTDASKLGLGLTAVAQVTAVRAGGLPIETRNGSLRPVIPLDISRVLKDKYADVGALTVRKQEAKGA